jgi:exosortase/archaeosortase family protein
MKSRSRTGMVSANNNPEVDEVSQIISPAGSEKAPRVLLFALALTLIAISADQYLAPILHTTSPLWATAACLILVWRRRDTTHSTGNSSYVLGDSKLRVARFIAAHAMLVLGARSLTGILQPVAGTLTLGGTLFAALKLSVLIPTLLLLPIGKWREVAHVYAPETTAGVVVLLTFFPSRVLEALWPWYGQVLGQIVFLLSRFLVPGLNYINGANPTLDGAELDVTIVPECSGINGLELFGLLFALVVICDWNRLRKKATLFAYFAGLFAMLLGNALRITSFVVFGNHGFAESIVRFHISAGWIFFSIVFLAYLSTTYRWMLMTRKPATEVLPASQ